MSPWEVLGWIACTIFAGIGLMVFALGLVMLKSAFSGDTTENREKLPDGYVFFQGE